MPGTRVDSCPSEQRLIACGGTVNRHSGRCRSVCQKCLLSPCAYLCTYVWHARARDWLVLTLQPMERRSPQRHTHVMSRHTHVTWRHTHISVRLVSASSMSDSTKYTMSWNEMRCGIITLMASIVIFFGVSPYLVALFLVSLNLVAKCQCRKEERGDETRAFR